MKHPWIILFDIDGTLLTVNKSFIRPLLKEIIDQLGIDYLGLESDSFSGRTDHDILSSFLSNYSNKEYLYKQLKSKYLHRLEMELNAQHIHRLPYVDDAISFFSQHEFIPGLLTGNFPKAAKTKLKAASIHLDYKIGAYGEFHKDRNMLPKVALNVAQELLDIKVDPQKFIIIGDTPKDIECAKTNNMCSVAVTTGNFSKKELEKFSPDMVLDSLKEPQVWFKQLIKDRI
jgi:phosphoglycolate phosphatase-like HAD superfamily hydrolase